MNKLALNATTLRIILAIALLIVFATIVVIFVLGQGQLVRTAKETSDLATEVATSATEQLNLDRTKRDLLDQQESIERAASIVAVSESYKYQDQIILEVGELARRSGIVVEGVTFDDVVTDTPAPAAATATPANGETPDSGAPATESSTESGADTPAAPAAPSLKTRSATITIESPIEYDRLISFVYLIEQNITKMRIMSLNLSADRDSDNKNAIISDAVTIEVYLN